MLASLGFVPLRCGVHDIHRLTNRLVTPMVTPVVTPMGPTYLPSFNSIRSKALEFWGVKKWAIFGKVIVAVVPLFF